MRNGVNAVPFVHAIHTRRRSLGHSGLGGEEKVRELGRFKSLKKEKA